MVSMKDSFDAIKKTVFDEVVKTSRNYVLREQVRAELTEMVRLRISSGAINGPEDIQTFIQAMKAAVGMLESVPFESWSLIDRLDR